MSTTTAQCEATTMAGLRCNKPAEHDAGHASNAQARRFNYMTRGFTKNLRNDDGTLATYVLICDGPGHHYEMNAYNSEQEAAAALASALRRRLACSACGRIDH